MPGIKDYEAMVKLSLTDDERELLTRRFNAVTDGFASLDGIAADSVAPLVTVLNLQNVLREDTAGKLVTREELLSNAPEQYDGYFQVPGTL